MATKLGRSLDPRTLIDTSLAGYHVTRSYVSNISGGVGSPSSAGAG